MEINWFLSIFIVFVLFSTAKGNLNIRKIIVNGKLNTFFISLCIGEEYDMPGNETEIDVDVDEDDIEGIGRICFVIIDPDEPVSICYPVRNETPCSENGNFPSLEDCEEYVKCRRKRFNWFC